MNKAEKLGRINLISSILQYAYRGGYETYISIKTTLNSDINDEQQEYFPEQQLHEYMSTLRERIWQ